MDKYTVFFAEDENDISTLLRYNLENEGFNVLSSNDGEDALDMIFNNSPDVVLLDWMLPTVSGIEICKRIREDREMRNVPVIMVSARGEETDKILGLDTGADDYVTKPFSMKELIARINSLLRRFAAPLPNGKLNAFDVVMDLDSHTVSRGEGESVRPIHLGPTEFRLLQCLMENPDKAFSREELLKEVWGESIYVEARTIDVHVRRLRKVLNNEGEKDIIRTVRSIGYALVSEADEG
ncbi:MAG: phosphate regulon transcriptional regulatory protein PhoB [Alphaproteobacteria bacterium]|nr:phosphate regulon transcriptional regulatory protein PhoB [Alphaproteobacteria bacterium]